MLSSRGQNAFSLRKSEDRHFDRYSPKCDLDKRNEKYMGIPYVESKFATRMLYSYWEIDISYKNHCFPPGKLKIRALMHAARSVHKI